ncbi:MAG: CdiA family toxin C-terminal domain-containing protein [Actinomycetota bacterium]
MTGGQGPIGAGTDEVQADTADLSIFIDRGAVHLAKLQAVEEGIEARRAGVVAAIGADAPLPIGRAPFGELLSETTISTAFVTTVRDALAAFAGGEGLAVAPAGVVDVALHADGLALTGADRAAAIDDALADRIDGVAYQASRLERLLAEALARGDHAAAQRYRLNLDRLILDQLDDETRAAVALGRNHEEIFGQDGPPDDPAAVIEALAAGAGDDRAARDLRHRLRRAGIRGEELDAVVAELTAAADHYRRNPDDLAELAAADGSDGFDLSEADAWLVAADRTRGPDTLAEAVIRQEAIAGWVAVADLGGNRLVESFDGDGPLGSLEKAEQAFLVDAFVGSRTAAALTDPDGLDIGRNGGLRELALIGHDHTGDDHPALTAALADSLTRQATLTEQTGGDADQAAAVSSTLVMSLFSILGPEQAAAHLDDLTPKDAALVAAALALDRPLRDGHPTNAVDLRAEAAAAVTVALVERAEERSGAGGPALGDAGGGFVLMLLSTASTEAYTVDGWPTRFADVVPRAVAVAANPGDRDAQDQHGTRLVEIYGHGAGRQLLTPDGSDLDAATRSLLVQATIAGRVPTGHPAGPLEYWTVDTFVSDHEALSAAVTVEVARALHRELHGTEPTATVEAELAAIVGTDQGRDLFGLGGRTTFADRNRLIHMVLDRGWTAEQFHGGGDGWDNPLVNGEYLVQTALLLDPDNPPTDAQLDAIRAIGESEGGRNHLGLDTALHDADREVLIELILANGWTADTFAVDPLDNDVVNDAVARHHAERFAAGTELAEQLADRSAAVDAEGFVRLALGLEGGGGDATVDRIVDELYENWEVDDIEVIPVHLRTGGQSANLLLFGVKDSSGATHYIDLNGKHYDDPGDWWQHNELPPGRVSFAGSTDGTFGQSTFISPAAGEDGGITLVSGRTKNYPDTTWERYGQPVLTGVIIVGSIAVIVGSLGTATPFVSAGAAATIGTGGTLLLGSAAAYQIYEGGTQLYHHLDHGGDWSDPVAREAYLTLGDGALTAVTAGGAGLVGVGGRQLGPRLAGTLRWANRGTEAAEAGINLQQAIRILESDLSPSEKQRQLAMIGVLSAFELGLPATTNHLLDRTPEVFRATRPDLDRHIVYPDRNPDGSYRISNGGLSGGHNAVEFQQALADPFGLGEPALVLGRTPVVRADGVTIGETISYRLPAREGNGAIKLDDNGDVVYKAAVKDKTVYFPNVISDQEMTSWLRNVGIEALNENVDALRADPNGRLLIPVEDRNIKILVYLKLDANGTPTVDNVHPIDPKGTNGN